MYKHNNAFLTDETTNGSTGRSREFSTQSGRSTSGKIIVVDLYVLLIQ